MFNLAEHIQTAQPARARDIETITGEILKAKRTGGEAILTIGRGLLEAKALADRDEMLSINYGNSLAASVAGTRLLLDGLDQGWDAARMALPVPFPTAGKKKGILDLEAQERMKAIRKRCKTQLDSLAELYQQTTGQPLSRFYRPPQGKYSQENLRQAQALGYNTVFWSLAYVDWYTDNQPTAEQAYSKLLPRIHDGAIVLLHSTSRTNAEILDELLTRWEAMGYRFASLEELPGL